jgi:hypothetical protein
LILATAGVISTPVVTLALKLHISVENVCCRVYLIKLMRKVQVVCDKRAYEKMEQRGIVNEGGKGRADETLKKGKGRDVGLYKREGSGDTYEL